MKGKRRGKKETDKHKGRNVKKKFRKRNKKRNEENIKLTPNPNPRLLSSSATLSPAISLSKASRSAFHFARFVVLYIL